MFRALLAKEIGEALSSRRTWVILALCLVMIPLGVEVSLKDYRSRLQNYRESVRIYQEETKKVEDIINKEGAKAFAPPSPLSFLSLGLELVSPNVAETQYRYANPPAVMRLGNNQGLDNLYEFFYGPLDLVFIVSVVMSFLAIMLTYGSIAGEKEQGTLRQVLSNAMPRANVILAKACATWLQLIVPFLVALGVSFLILEIQGNPASAMPGAWSSVGLAVLISILFISAFLNLGLLVSSLTKQAVSALVVLLLAWVFLYGIYPRLSAAAAQIIFPLKSEERIALEKDQIRRNVEKERNAEVERVVQTMPADPKSQAYQEAMKKQEDLHAVYQSKLKASWKALDRDLDERQRAAVALAANIARLSPVSSYVRPLAELSRTGWMEHEEFITSVSTFEEVLNREIFEKLLSYRTGRGSLSQNNADNSASAPQFVFVRAPAGALVRTVFPDMVVLILFNFVFFAGAFVAFLRYDVR